MNRRASLVAAVALTALAGAAVAPRMIKLSGANASTPALPTSATASLVATGGAAIGSATLTESTRGVLIRLQASGLPAGRHGLHIHAKGDCGDAKFQNAGGHLHAQDASVHGLLNASATDTGDLPNVTVDPSGRLDVEVFTSFVTLGGFERAAVLDDDGAALILHADPDDHTTQPIGGAGARIACGVIKPGR